MRSLLNQTATAYQVTQTIENGRVENEATTSLGTFNCRLVQISDEEEETKGEGQRIVKKILIYAEPSSVVSQLKHNDYLTIDGTDYYIRNIYEAKQRIRVHHYQIEATTNDG